MNVFSRSLGRGAVSNIHLQWSQILIGIMAGLNHSGDIAILSEVCNTALCVKCYTATARSKNHI